jgi:hypothetical protein
VVSLSIASVCQRSAVGPRHQAELLGAPDRCSTVVHAQLSFVSRKGGSA